MWWFARGELHDFIWAEEALMGHGECTDDIRSSKLCQGHLSDIKETERKIHVGQASIIDHNARALIL